MVFAEDGFIANDRKEEILKDLDELCRMITAFSRSLKGSAEHGAKI